MLSQDMVMDAISRDWDVLVWAAQRGIVASSQRDVVKHFDRINRKRVANAVRCGCPLCLKAIDHLVQPVAK